MYDAHYDLLTILYFRMKKDNKFKDIEGLIKDLMSTYKKDNIIGGIINLYFMTKDEMKEKLDIDEEEYLDVPLMFEKSINNLECLKEAGIIPKDTDFLYSIEGCDYIKDEKELEELYNLGLRAIAPVWNEKNKYGSGIREVDGLTKTGEVFLKKAINLGMIIDVSHANQKTFFDIMDLVQKEKEIGKEVFVIASHSNVKELCDTSRNLTDEQLLRLKEVGGYIGLLVHAGFLNKDYAKFPFEDRKKYFVEHLKYVTDVIGFDEDRVMVSTDNMNFNPDDSYHNLEAIKLDRCNQELRELLGNYYNDDFVNKILQENMSSLFTSVRSYNKNSEQEYNDKRKQ